MMKKRIITGILLAVFVAPFLYFGTYFMASFALLILILGIYEFLNIKKKANQSPIPLYIYFITFVFSFLLIFDIPVFNDYALDYSSGLLNHYNLNILWFILFLIILFTCSVFDKKFSIMDAVYVFSVSLYLVLGLKGMLYLRSFGGKENINDGLFLILYVLLVTCFTDIFAYFGGMTCYKIIGSQKVHKLNERISPKKTIEGTIIGTLFGTIFGFLFSFFLFKNTNLPSYSPFIYLLMSLIISLTGQIGDLILSAVKRFFDIKDFSNILPGHGGILDRMDSLLINSMVTAIFMSLLSYIV